MPVSVIRSIRREQEFYDADPERYERIQRQREEEREQERQYEAQLEQEYWDSQET
jgi:hypothetical protein